MDRKAYRKRLHEKLRALFRTQKINELVEKTSIESQALQYSGDDRPITEGHVIDLLEKNRVAEKDQQKLAMLVMYNKGHKRRGKKF